MRPRPSIPTSTRTSGSTWTSTKKSICTETRFDRRAPDGAGLPDEPVWGSAEAGETVTLTLTAEDGYGLKTNGIKAYDGEGANAAQVSLTLTEQSTGVWTFAMPADVDALVVVAELEWKSAPPTGNRELEQTVYIKDGTAHGTVYMRYLDDQNYPYNLYATVTAAAEQTGNDNLKHLTRALYAYSQAAIAIKG